MGLSGDRLTLVVALLVCGGARAFLETRLVDGIEKLVRAVTHLPRNYRFHDGEEFDYIVVGAGGAGSAVASRLALAGFDTLLVEAGGDPSPLTKIPMAAMSLIGSSDDWAYPTLSNNRSCLAFEGRQCRFSRGRALGGSTSINYMMYLRGNPRDYDYDVPGWTWEELRPYFLRYEGLQAELPTSSAPYHNTSGTFKVDFFDEPNIEWHDRLERGFEELNFPINFDMNAESQIGVSRVIGYTNDGQRNSAATAYLRRRDVRDQLKVAKRTRCTRVLLDRDNKAYGITVTRTGLLGVRRNATLRARREVILSAGAIGTAHILQLSGIGPADHLRALGVPVRADLPVGVDFSDHVLPLLFVLVERDGLRAAAATAAAAGHAARWALARDGPFASNGLTDMTALLNSRCYDDEARALLDEVAGEDCQLPTLQYINAYLERGLMPLGRAILKASLRLNDDVIDQLAAANAKHAMMIVTPVVLDPASRGQLRLASTDPLADPAIYPNFLSEESDVDEMVRAITIAQHLTETAAYRARNATLLRLRLDGCPAPGEGADEEYWRCYVRHMTFSVFHSTGTARLGDVLDGCLRVRGVTRLRVADLSALRRVPRGNTAAAAMALGERLADFLLNPHTCRDDSSHT